MKDLSPDQRLIVALDVRNATEALELVDKLSPVITTFKIGYSLAYSPGLHKLVDDLRARKKQIFLDAKLNDIPATVRRGVYAAGMAGYDFITVHSESGLLDAAMQGAEDALCDGQRHIRVMAVTALTSQPHTSSRDRFRAGVVNAIIAGCDGLIMSPQDISDPLGTIGGNVRDVRGLAGEMIIATPGVRCEGERMDDHSRSGTPREAVNAGADYIIVGRPIILSNDPLAEAQRIIDSIR